MKYRHLLYSSDPLGQACDLYYLFVVSKYFKGKYELTCLNILSLVLTFYK